MTELAEFLLARYAEDEAAAREAIERDRAGSDGPWRVAGGRHHSFDNGRGEDYVAVTVEHPAGPWDRILVKRDDGTTAAHIARWDPTRVLAECEAKRRIVELHQIGHDPCDAHDAWFESIPCETLEALALPYADHPDYRQEWRP